MSRKHFIGLADAIKAYNECAFRPGTNVVSPLKFTHTQLLVLADFCRQENPRFDRDLWIDYINGKRGPHGGAR